MEQAQIRTLLYSKHGHAQCMHERATTQANVQSNQNSPYNRNGTIPPRPFVIVLQRQTVIVLQRQTVMPPWHVATLHPPAKQAGRSGGETEWPHRGMSMTACGVTRRHCDNASACRIAAWRRRNATSKANNMAACSIAARRANDKAAKRHTSTYATAATRRHGTLSLFRRTHLHHIGSTSLHLAIPRETRLRAGKAQNRAERIAQRNRVVPRGTFGVNEVANHNDRAARLD